MQKLDLLIEEYKKSEDIAALSVSVTDREKTLYLGGFGAQSVTRPEARVTGNTLFRIASITKLFTGITVLKLCEGGLLELDAPIKKHLPGLTLSNRDATESVTMRHLLSHTAGLPSEYTPNGEGEEAMLGEVLQSALPTLELIGAPGEKYLYSNWGIRLASLVASEITGKPFSQLCNDLLIEPLGLKDTTFSLAVALRRPLCFPHERDGGGGYRQLPKINENATRLATGGLFSSARDLAAFGRMLLCDGVSEDGKRIVKGEWLSEMRKWISTTKTGNGYGLTTIIYPCESGFLYGHTGFAPPYNSALLYDLEGGLAVSVLANTESKKSKDLAKEILNTVKATKNES